MLNYESCPTGALGAGEDQRIKVTTRGGGITIVELTPDPESYFERKIDETSTAEVTATLSGTNAECCQALGDVTVGFDLEWWRGENLVWAGPIEFVRWSTNSVYLQAQDLTSWWSKRLAKTHQFLAMDPAIIVQKLHEAAMAEDPIAGFNLSVRHTGEVATLNSFFEEFTYYSDLINGLADYAIDYTAYGRNVLVGSSDFLPALSYYLTDDDWISPPSVEAKGGGTGLATRIYGTNANGDIAVATADDTLISIYGLIERSFTFDHIETKEDLKKAVQSHLDIYSFPYYVNFHDGDPILKQSAAIPFEALIPGVQIRVEAAATCKTLMVPMRIASVRNEGSGLVSLGLQPKGSVAEIL